MDDGQNRVHGGMREERPKRMHNDRFSSQGTVLLRDFAPGPRSATRGDNDRGDRHESPVTRTPEQDCYEEHAANATRRACRRGGDWLIRRQDAL